MSGTYTSTRTFTVVDIRRVVDCFAADYDMIAQATGLATPKGVTDTVHDVKLMAEMGYLHQIDLVLKNAAGIGIRAAKYEVSTDAYLWTMQRPGNNLWPATPSGTLTVVVSYTEKWKNLNPEAKTIFKEALYISWSASDIDLSYPSMIGRSDRTYASNGYGMQRTTYS